MNEMRTKCRIPILVCLCVLFVCGGTAPIENDSPAPENLSSSIEEADIPQLEKNQTLRVGLNHNTTDNTDGLFSEEHQQEVTTLDTNEHNESQEATVLARKPEKKLNDSDNIHDEVKDDEDPSTPLPTLEDKVTVKIPDEKEEVINKNGEYVKPDKSELKPDQEEMTIKKENFGQEKDEIIPKKKEITIGENVSESDRKETTSDKGYSEPSKDKSRPKVDHLYLSFKNNIDPLDASATESNETVTNNITRKFPLFPSSLSFPPELNEYFKNPYIFYPPRFSLNKNFDKEPNKTEFHRFFENQNSPSFNYDFLRPLYYDKGLHIYNNNPYDSLLDRPFSFRQPYRPQSPLRFGLGPLSHGGSKSVYVAPQNKIKGVQLVNGQVILIDDLGLPVRTGQTESQTKPNLDYLENPQKDKTFHIKPFSPFHSQGERPIYFSGKDFVSPYFHSPSSYDPFDRTIRPFDFDDVKYQRPPFGFTSLYRPQYKTSDE